MIRPGVGDELLLNELTGDFRMGMVTRRWFVAERYTGETHEVMVLKRTLRPAKKRRKGKR